MFLFFIHRRRIFCVCGRHNQQNEIMTGTIQRQYHHLNSAVNHGQELEDDDGSDVFECHCVNMIIS